MSEISKFRNRNSFLWKLMYSSLIPGLCTIAVLSVVFFPMMLKSAVENDEAYEQAILYSVSSTLDDLRISCENVRGKIQQSEWVHDVFIDHVLNGKRIDPLVKRDIQLDFGRWVAEIPNAMIGDIQFNREPDALYSNQGIFDNIEFFRNYMETNIQYYFFEAPKGFSTVEFSDKSYLLYYDKFTDIFGGSAKGAMNLLFDSDKIGRQLDAAANNKAISFRILNSEGEELWRYSARATKERTFMISSGSRLQDYFYEIEVPASVHRQTVQSILPFLLFAILIDVVLCLLIAVALSIFVYRPIDSTVRMVAGTVPEEQNEFEILNLAMNRIIKEKEETENSLVQIRPFARQKMISALLDGSVLLADFAAEQLERCEIAFLYPLFNVIALQIPFSELQNVFPKEDPDKQAAELAMETLCDHISELTRLRSFLYFDDSDHYRIIVNYEKTEDLRDYLDQLSGACIQYFRKAGIEEKLFFGAGKAVRTKEEIYRASSQAVIAMNFARLNHTGSIVFYQEVSPQVNNQYSYPFAEQMLLARAVSDGNAESAKAVLQQIVELNGTLGPNSFRQLYSDLVSTLLRSAQGLGIRLDPKEYDDPTDLSEAVRSIGDMIDSTCAQIEQRRSETADSAEQKILKYIDDNLYDPDLSLSRIAENFHKSPAYISLLFKSQRDTNYSDYINRARISRAIELMTDQKLDSNEVYPLVGYVSLSTFRRNFAKYTKCNPRDFSSPEDGK